jgi:hypothetical protein
MENEVPNNEVIEDYNPVEPVYYNYKAKEKLILYFDENISNFNHVYICPYQVNTTSRIPFLSFLFEKSKLTNNLKFPEAPIFKHFESSELINYSKTFLFGLCNLSNFENFIESIIFNGFYIFENNLYLFFDITNCQIKLNDVYSNSPLWFAILDEIVNHTHVCNLKIDKNIVNLFTSNDEFCFLTDINNNSYEIPVISFIGTSNDLVNFKYTFGESSQNKNAILGPYFYFTNFNNAFINANNQYNDCIIRFAIFTGHVKYIENNIDDPIDESEIKLLLLKDTNSETEYNIEQLTMRRSDHDGLWAREYNSAYLGVLELDNGTYLKNTPLIVVKEYEQQIPLSYHYTNKKRLEEDKEQYSIL